MELLAYAAIYLIWGSTFLAIRVAVASIPPLAMMGARCLAAGLLLIAAAAIRGDRPALRDWRAGLAGGVLMFGLPYAALGWAETQISSGMAALLVATLPLWLVIIEWVRSGRPSPRPLAGLVIGLVGVVVLAAPSLTLPSSALPMIAIVGGELSWAIGSVQVQPRLPRPVTLSAGMPLASGGVLLLLASAGVGELRHFDLRAVMPASVLALGYLVFFGSILGFSAYMFLLGRAPASRVATHAYVNPLIAVALGVVVAAEPLTISIVIASIVIAAGVALVLSARHQPADDAETLRSTAMSKCRTSSLVPSDS